MYEVVEHKNFVMSPTDTPRVIVYCVRSCSVLPSHFECMRLSVTIKILHPSNPICKFWKMLLSFTGWRWKF